MASDDRSDPTTPAPSPPPYADPPPTYALTPPRVASPTRSPSLLPKLAQPRGRRRCCRLPYILLVVSILVVIGIAIGLGVGLGLHKQTDVYGTLPARLSGSYMALGPTSTSTSMSMSTPAPAPMPTSTPESENGPDLSCPRTNSTLLTAQAQRFMKLCGIDWPAGRAAAVESESENGGTGDETVRDINDGTGSNRTGIVRRSFAACVDACAEYNINKAGSGDSPALYGIRSAEGCRGVSYVANMTWVDEGGVGNNRNCYLKTARAAEVVRVGNDIAVGMLLSS